MMSLARRSRTSRAGLARNSQGWEEEATANRILCILTIMRLLLRIQVSLRTQGSVLAGYSQGHPVQVMDFGQCGNDRPGFGVLAGTQKLRANNYKRFSGL
jgi:hypothetical protein